MRANPVRIALAAAIVLGSTPAARADFPPGGALVSTSDATLGHTHVRLFLDPTGDVVVVWRLHGLAGSSCAAQRITPEGANAAGWPGSGQSLSAQSYFDAAPDGAGGALAAYVTSDYDVRLERALGDGSRLPAPGPGWPVADTSQTEWYPAVAGDGAGGAYVAWVRGLSRVYLKRAQWDGSLAPGWPATGVAVFAGDTFLPQAVALASPALMPDGAGGTYLMWLSDRVRVQRVGGDGVVAPGWPDAGLTLGSWPPELYAGPLLRLLPSGAEHVLAAWVDRPAGGDSTRLFLQRFHRSCVIDPAWPASGRHVVTAGQITGNFTLVPDAQDGVTALWEEKSLPRMIHVRADGTLPAGYPAGGLSPLDANAEYAPGSLHTTIGPDGGVIVSWSDTRPSRPGIRVRWFLADGTPGPGEPDTARVATPEGVPATNRGLLANGEGGVFVAWQDDTQAASSSYLLRLSRTPAFTTPTLVSLVRAEATIERVILRWYTSESGFTASVERRAEGEGWTAIGSVGPEGGGLFVFEDRDVAAGARYDYRLAVVAAGGVEYLGQVRVEVPSRYLLAFLGVRPNPGVGRLAVWFSLATHEPARLEVLDVAGRRVLTRDLAGLAPGNHALDLGESERLAAGVYLVRIAQGGQRAAGKAAIVR